ncbi:hypothetical protein M569_06397 [Genlisea aurea]|uniref:Uncharacterized protein n=1 Tax=Genlisea aurea TaxID=192259 RepID=S8CMK8_9LAMI|nr:hypothetical protein M569_06397 [Genlisea aurea]
MSTKSEVDFEANKQTVVADGVLVCEAINKKLKGEMSPQDYERCLQDDAQSFNDGRRCRKRRKSKAEALEENLMDRVEGIVRSVAEAFQQAAMAMIDPKEEVDFETAVVDALLGLNLSLTMAQLMKVCDGFGKNRFAARLFLQMDIAGRVGMVREMVGNV